MGLPDRPSRRVTNAKSPDRATCSRPRSHDERRARGTLCVAAVFILFFFAYNRLTHVFLGRFVGRANGIPDDFAEWSGAGIPFLGSFQLDSDALVVARWEHNAEYGPFHEWPLLIDPSSGSPYESQIGLGGWLLSVPAWAVAQHSQLSLMVMYSLVAAVSASIAALVVVVSRRSLGSWVSLAIALALLQPWIVALSGSIYWFIGLKILPGVAAWWLIRVRRAPFPVVLIAVGALSLVSFASGYEFATVVVALPLAVLVFSWVSDEWPGRVILARSALLLAVQGAAFIGTLFIHAGVLAAYGPRGSDVVAQLSSIVAKRTGIGYGSIDTAYGASIEASPNDVLSTYLSMPVLGAPLSIPVVSLFSVAVLLAVGLSTLPFLARVHGRGAPERVTAALGAAWLVSLLGPIGWYTLAKPHSYVHTHINFALWFLPTIPLAVAFLGLPASIWARTLVKQRGLSILVVMVGGTLIACMCIAYLSVARG